MNKGYTQKDIQKITGTSINTTQLWAKDALVIPSLSEEKKGKMLRRPTRLYSAQDVILIAILSTLASYGYSRDLLKSFSVFMHRKKKDGRTNKEILFDPTRFKSNDIFILKFTDKNWTWSEGLREDEKKDKDIVLHAERPTAAQIINNNKIVIWINVSKIAEEVIRKL